MALIKYKPTNDLIEILVEDVKPTLTGFDDRDNDHTVNVNTNVVVSGKINIPDTTFRVPFKRVDTGRVQLMVAEVINGCFTMTVNFATSGKWVVNSELVNSELHSPTFQLSDHIFYVV